MIYGHLIFNFDFLQFFAEAGFPCPRRRNPSDHFLRCINSDFDTVTATLKGSQRHRVSNHHNRLLCEEEESFYSYFRSIIIILCLNMQDIPTTADPLTHMATSQIKARLVEKYKRGVYAKKVKERIRELSSIVSPRNSE